MFYQNLKPFKQPVSMKSIRLLCLTIFLSCLYLTSIKAQSPCDVNPASVFISGNTIFCEGESATITANADVSTTFVFYAWSNSATTESIEINSAGTYTVTVTDENGCTATDDNIISEIPTPIPTIEGNLDYCGSAGTILSALTPTTIGSPYTAFTYAWSNGETTQSIAILEGTYSVTITDNGGTQTFPGSGCSGSISVVVTENPNPQPQIEGVLGYCEEDGNTALSVTGVNGTYLWSTGASTQSIDVSEGTYFVTVTDDNQCTGTASALVSEFANPSVIISGNNLHCENETTEITAMVSPTPVSMSDIVYIWSNGEQSQNIEVIQGTYTVTVTNLNECTATAELTVSEVPTPIPTIVGNLEYCGAEGTILSVLTPSPDPYTAFTYQWSNGEQSQTIAIFEGTYSVTITDNGGSSTFSGTGCSGSTSVVVTENPNPQPQIEGVLGYCEEDGSTALSVTGVNGTYLWSTGASTQSIDVSEGTYFVTVTDDNQCTGTASALVSEFVNPSVIISGNNLHCENETTEITAMVSPTPVSMSDIVYIWSNGEQSQNIEVIQGTYTVTVTNLNECTATAELTVSEVPTPIPTIVGNLEYCGAEGTILSVLTPSPDPYTAFTYQWSNGEQSQTIAVFEGTYSVTITDNGGSSTFPGTGCSGSTSVVVTENPNPQPQIEGALGYCAGENTTLTVTGANGTYLWSTGESTQSITVLEGTYFVTVTDDNQCTGTASALVLEYANPSVIIAGNSLHCENETTEITAIVSPTPVSMSDIVYIWSNGEQSENIEVSEGTYTVTITNLNECTAIAELVVSEVPTPIPTIEGNLEYCAGESTILTALTPSLDPYVAFTYLWSTGETTQIIEVTEGAYSVTITDNGGSFTFSGTGCSGSASVMVEENANPQPQIEGALEYCTGESTFLTVSGDYEVYEWSNSANTSFVEVLEGTYALTVTDENECVGMDEVTVIENANPQPVILGETIICAGDQTMLNANHGFETYLWNTGQTSPNIIINSAGTYSVEVMDENGCSGTASVFIQVTSQTNAVVIENTTLCNNTLVSAENSLILMDLVTSGDQTGTWRDADENAVSNFNALGLALGNYAFEYTIEGDFPCENKSYQTTIQVVDCNVVCAELDGQQEIPNRMICSDESLVLSNGSTIDNDVTGSEIEWVYSEFSDFDAYSSAAIPFTGFLPTNTGCEIATYYFKAHLTATECLDQTVSPFEVQVYPDLSSTTTSIADDCSVTVETCEGFHIVYQDVLYTTTATIELSSDSPNPTSFTITNPNAPTNCKTIQIEQPFVCAPAIVGDFVWEDANANGRQDANENGLNGVTVNLLDGSGKKSNLLQTTQTFTDINTGKEGFYEFRNVSPGDYIIQFEVPQGKYTYAPQNIGSNTKDSDASALTGETKIFTLQSGEINTTIDAGFVPTCGELEVISKEISVCHGESADLEVFLTNANSEEILWSTGETGSLIQTGKLFNETCEPIRHQYSATLMQADNCMTVHVDFEIIVYPNPALQAKVTMSEDNCMLVAEACPEVGIAYRVMGQNLVLGDIYTAEPGDNLVPVEFIFTSPFSCGNTTIFVMLNCLERASVGDFVWEDENRNGFQDEGELGLSNVTVSLLDKKAEVIATVSTNENGFYLFEDLVPDNYQLQFDSLEDYLFTLPNQGNTELDSDANENGLTVVFTLEAGENQDKMDAGLVRDCPYIQEIFETTSLQICNGEPINIAVQTIDLEDNQTLLFVLHENEGDVFETAIAFGASPDFETLDLAAGSYAVSVIVGVDADGDDLPDETDFCYDLITQNDAVIIQEAIVIEENVEVTCGEEMDSFTLTVLVNGGAGSVYQLEFNGVSLIVNANQATELGPFEVGNPYEIVVTDAFGCQAIASGFPECTVPVSLLDFNGTAQTKGNLLQWTTATEVNNDFFSLFHSTDGNHFEVVGKMDGKGSSSQTNSYEFFHAFDGSAQDFGVHYYYLTQTDFDGTKQRISATIAVHNEHGEAFGNNRKELKVLGVYPIPVKDLLTLQLENVENYEELQIELFDIVGRKIVLPSSAMTWDTEEKLQLDVRDLTTGVYFLKLGGGSTVVKFLVE